MESKHKVAVVTGAAQGIGRKTSEVLAGYGFAVVLNDLRTPVETAKTIANAGGVSLEAVGDISREDEAKRIAGSVVARFGRVDVLVNNAGISFIGPAEQ